MDNYFPDDWMPGPDNWMVIISDWVALIEQLVEGSISACAYREKARDPDFTPGSWGDASPIYPVLAELRHDANEFVPSDEVRDNEDMSPEELKMRASFGRDVLKQLVLQLEHHKSDWRW